jgi:3-hydroxyisobutyrate dehydrogenase
VSQHTPRVAVVGLGRIGGGAVRSLGRGDFDLVGYDIDPAAVERVAGIAAPASSLAEAAAAADVVLVAVFDDAQVRDALEGDRSLLAAEPPPKAIVILSTVSVETIHWAAEQGRARGVEIVDCGVSGGKAIEQGTIAAMVGGTDAAVATVRPVLEGFASPVVHMGALGTGMQAKLARNMIVYGCWYVASEAARLAAAAGIAVERLIEVSDAADRSSGGPTGMLKRALSTDPDELVNLRRTPEYAHKDLQTALALGRELGLDLPAATLVEERFDGAVESADAVVR